MGFEEAALLALQRLLDVLTRPAGIVAAVAGGIAVALLVAATAVKTMAPLRWLTAGSNAGFVVCGAMFPSFSMLLLHGLLLPINLARALQMTRLARRVKSAVGDPKSGDLWLRPYMRRQRLKAGEIVFNRGDEADRLYMLADGRIELAEIGRVLEPGRIFGEIAFFAPDRLRTQTARCLEPCLLLSINENTMRQLYFQNPAFGFELTALVASRLSADVRRLQAEVNSLRDAAEARQEAGTAAPA